MSFALFKDYLHRENLDKVIKPMKVDEPIKTAEKAASVIHCKPVQIVKSLVVRSGGRYYIFLVPGNERVTFDLVSDVLGAEAQLAKPEEVKYITGYSIGAVPPFGHKRKLKSYVIPDFPEDQTLYAAAGDINRVFGISYNALVMLSAAEVFGE